MIALYVAAGTAVIVGLGAYLRWAVRPVVGAYRLGMELRQELRADQLNHVARIFYDAGRADEATALPASIRKEGPPA